MAQKYDRQILSDQLADLGAKLGHAPMPYELEQGMASRKTYLRHFDNSWDLALEYAGFSAEERAEAHARARSRSHAKVPQKPKNENTEQTTPGSEEIKQVIYPFRTAASRSDIHSEAPRPADWRQDDAKLINLYDANAFIVDASGKETRLQAPYQGKAMAVMCQVRRAFAERALSNIIPNMRVTLSEKAESLVILQPGNQMVAFPKYQPGIYYLVSRKAAYAARDVGRETYDLLYPSSVKHQGGGVVIRHFEMINTPRTWWINPGD